MKKLAYLFLAVGVMVFASCETAGKKSEGTYTGNHTIPGFSTQLGSVIITSTGDQAVTMNLICSAAAMNTNALGVTSTLNNNVVTYTFTGSGTTNYDVLAVSGNLTDKTLAISYTIYYGGIGIGCTFTGTKP